MMVFPEDGTIAAQEHICRVEQRWVGLERRMTAKVETLVVDRSSEIRLLNQALSAKTLAKKVFWLRKAADKATETIVESSACSSGCSHCCHISVILSRSEALQIARETGRTLNSQAGRFGPDQIDVQRERLTSEMYGKPCTFLVEGRCSIYEFRPQACRLQINMDDDDLLCKLVAHGAPRVPYLDMRHHYFISAQVMDGAHDDLRNWFPE